MITIVEDEHLGMLLSKDYNGPLKYPVNVVKKFKMRVNSIQSAKSEQDLRNIGSLHFEKLKEKRYEGKYSIRIDKGWRLILSITKDKVTIVHIEEISNHYK